MGELLGALGLAWPRLLIYPGGAAALLAAWLLGRLWPAAASGRGLPLWDALPPLAVLALLPLPPARGFPFGLDLPTALLLLEWPRLRSLPPDTAPGALLRSYGPLLLAAAALAAGAGSLSLSDLTGWPEDLRGQALLAGGGLAWLAWLPRLLAGGPGGWPGRLRALGLLLLGALPLLGGLALLARGRLPDGLGPWVLPPLAALLAGAVVAAAARATRRSSA